MLFLDQYVVVVLTGYLFASPAAPPVGTCNACPTGAITLNAGAYSATECGCPANTWGNPTTGDKSADGAMQCTAMQCWLYQLLCPQSGCPLHSLGPALPFPAGGAGCLACPTNSVRPNFDTSDTTAAGCTCDKGYWCAAGAPLTAAIAAANWCSTGH
jgi:hypothetical protein